MEKAPFLVISLVLASLSFLLLWPRQVQAQMMQSNMMGQVEEQISEAGEHRDLPEVLQEILQTHSWQQLDEVVCDQVTDIEWESLGEAVMGQMHPDSQQHEAMDQMMGGEGSESLKQAHIGMGQNYLGCASGNFWGQGMMSGGMLGMMGSFGRGMMTTTSRWSKLGESTWLGWGWGWGHMVLGGILWVTLIVFLLSGTYFFLRQARKQ